MDFLDLPTRTKVGRVVPKNAFDGYTNTKQKKQFSDNIQRIIWTHKISSETVNLESKEIKEIQIFRIELKVQTLIPIILEIINKAIPYHIVFLVVYKEQAYISISLKYPHPANEDVSVIDWTFESNWFDTTHIPYKINLSNSLDAVFKDLCVQLTGKPELSKKSMDLILHDQREIYHLKKKIGKLKSAISRSKQFNEKVQFNIKLKEAEKELDKFK